MPLPIDLADIVELGTRVATSGSVRAGEIAGDDVFEYVVATVALIYELSPG